MTNELNKWSTTYQKPIIISEYGADAMPGVHCVRKIRELILVFSFF